MMVVYHESKIMWSIWYLEVKRNNNYNRNNKQTKKLIPFIKSIEPKIIEI